MISTLAEKAANNHADFDSFAWHDAPADREDWTLVYTSCRDSGPLERANADTIAGLLTGNDVIPQHHNHWAVGYVDGYAIRVYRDGKITDAFRAWCDIQSRLADYPVLDDDRLAEYEQAEIDDAWDCWIRDDFQRAFKQKLGIVPKDLRKLFDAACKTSGEYPYHDGHDVCCDIDRLLTGLPSLTN